MNEFMKGVVCLGLVVILFLLADYLEINSFKDLFQWAMNYNWHTNGQIAFKRTQNRFKHTLSSKWQ